MATKDKYDRQLRLWGTSGQAALGSCTVILINATAAGTETLKNLILPGIGHFHIIDDDDDDDDAVVVDDDDGGNDSASFFTNFFVFPTKNNCDEKKTTTEKAEKKRTDQDEKEKNTSSRAQIAMKHLGELNPDCKGSYQAIPSLEDVDYAALLSPFFSNRQQRGKRKILVVAADLSPYSILPLSTLCHDQNVPLVIVRSYGLIGYVRVQVGKRGHPIIESRPDNTIPDLRLSTLGCVEKKLSFKLQQLVKEEVGRELRKLDKMSRGHIPFVLILLIAMDRWRNGSDEEQYDGMEEHDDTKNKKLPQTLEEKNQFRKVIIDMAREFAALEKWRESLSGDAEVEKDDDEEEEDVEPMEIERVEQDGVATTKQMNPNSLRLPTTPEEKISYEQILNDMSGPSSFDMDLNFEEAHREAYLAYSTKELPYEVQQLLDAAEEQDIAGTDEIAKFNLLLLALKRFIHSNEGQPPLNGSIPDMASSTDLYIKLQEIYKTQAMEDISTMKSILSSIRKENQGKITLPEITTDELTSFCKNVHNLQLLKSRSYAEEYAAHTTTTTVTPSNQPTTEEEEEIQSDLQMSAMDPYEIPDHTPLLWYISLCACDVFYQEQSCRTYPGGDSRALALQSDARQIQMYIKRIVRNMKLNECELIQSTLLSSSDGENKHAKEMVRYNNAEIHTIASVVGGVASQEAVKLITGQYVPILNTFVYNGIASTAGVYRF